uniref:RING-type E3 ubiquitin transferase n=1 Tax=Linum usitatissimum TaxID=4006 RepID=I6XNG6_LINUS|nr:U-box domain-containing protein [Linum usitatissimum]
MTPAPPLPAAVDSIHRSLSELCSTSPDQESFENTKQFTGYAHRLQLVFSQILRSSASLEELPASVETGLRGISEDLSDAAETVSVYRKRSKIFVLVNCQSLCASLLERTVAMGTWLELIESSLLDDFLSDLRKKTSDLSRDMKQAKFRVTENEERVRRTLEKEGQGRMSSKAVQSAIIMDLARALGIDASNHQELSEQVKLFKTDVARSSSVAERRIMISLEKILDNWSSDPDAEALNEDLNSEDEAHLSPFRNFLCPLTKEYMKEPVVVLESSQNYDKKAILYWFSRCVEDGRDPTCPVTGMVLKTTELKPNLGLAGAIDEWICRNVEVRVNSSVEHISKEPFVKESIERALDSVYRISEEHSSYRYKVRNAGLVVLIVNLLRKSSKDLGSRLRGKALMALLSMAKDEESKKIMLDEGVTRLAVHSLVGNSDKEREYAVKLLLEFSNDEDYCIKITSEKGALFLLSSMAGNLENPALSNLADELLKRMESMEENVQSASVVSSLLQLLSVASSPAQASILQILYGIASSPRAAESVASRIKSSNGIKTVISYLEHPEVGHRINAFRLTRLLSERVPSEPSTCPIHNEFSCDDEGSQLCLLSNDCIKPLIDLLSDDNTNVQIAAVEALSTLVPADNSSEITKRGMNEFEQLRMVDAVIDLFMKLRPGELQEKTLWMVDKFLRAEGCSHRHSLNQALVGALVEALKHGNGNTKRSVWSVK